MSVTNGTPLAPFKSVISNSAISTSFVFTDPAVGKLVSVKLLVREGKMLVLVYVFDWL